MICNLPKCDIPLTIKHVAYFKLALSILIVVFSFIGMPYWEGMYDFAMVSPNTETNTVATIGIMRFPQFFVYRDVSYNWATMGNDALGNLKGKDSAAQISKLAENNIKKYKNSRKRFNELNLILPSRGPHKERATLDVALAKTDFNAHSVHQHTAGLYTVANGVATANTGAFVDTPFVYTSGSRPSKDYQKRVYNFYEKLEEACKTSGTTITKCVPLTPGVKPQIIANELHPWENTDGWERSDGNTKREYKYSHFNTIDDCQTKFHADLGKGFDDDTNYWLKDADLTKGNIGVPKTATAYSPHCRKAAFTPKCQCKAKGDGTQVGTTGKSTLPGLVTNFKEGKTDFTDGSDTGTYLFNKKGQHLFLWRDFSYGAIVMFLVITFHSIASPFVFSESDWDPWVLNIWYALEVTVYVWQWLVFIFMCCHLSAHNTMGYGFSNFLAESQEFAPTQLIRIEGPINDWKIVITVLAAVLVITDTLLVKNIKKWCGGDKPTKNTKAFDTQFGF